MNTLWFIEEMMLDYFEILEVDKSASQADIKKAYRRLAAKFHPDRNKSEDAIERFQSIQESYSVLSDPKKRTQYIEQEYTEVLNPKGFTASYWNRVLNA
jgi:DnaJ-class molecular chaperone